MSRGSDRTPSIKSSFVRTSSAFRPFLNRLIKMPAPHGESTPVAPAASRRRPDRGACRDDRPQARRIDEYRLRDKLVEELRREPLRVAHVARLGQGQLRRLLPKKLAQSIT